VPYTGNPVAVLSDAVRFKLGDTTSPYLFTDDEITYLLSEGGNNATLAALKGAEQLVARFAGLVDKTVGDLSISYSQKQAQYTALVEQLRKLYDISGAPPYCGGISITDKTAKYGERDRVAPQFYRGLHTRDE
jgi:hypothetical protein